jgi:hypothetical protein
MDNHVNVPYIVYEGEQARMERHTKRLVIALIISICLIFASNALWLYSWFQWDYVSEETTHIVDAENGIANYIGNNGDITNGANSSAESHAASVEEIRE